MKHPFLPALALGLALLAAGLHRAHADAVFTNNTISGNIRFANVNPTILNLLKAPGNEGMTNLYLTAASVAPDIGLSGTSDIIPANSRTNVMYSVTVPANNSGIRYAVSPRVSMLSEQQIYYFNTKTSAPVVAAVSGPTLDFAECLGVVTVKFVTSGGAPVAVDGGSLSAYDATSYDSLAQVSSIPAGATQRRIYVPGGRPAVLDVTVNRGTNYATDRIDYYLRTNVTVACDGFATVNIVVPGAGALATATGTVDMLREFEWSVPGYTAGNYPDYTSVIAYYGPYGNKRYANVPGDNISIPSSGAFTLSNVVASTPDPQSVGYAVYAQMLFRTNRAFEWFLSPSLGSGSNAALVVAPGASLNLSNTFTIDPGYLRGRITLQGPSESLGRASQLRGILHAGDYGDSNGIPSAAYIYGIYYSVVYALGVNRLASGATLTASGGAAGVDFDGTFNPGDSSFTGQYELALGGLKGERSIWSPTQLALVLTSGAVTNDNDYYFTGLTIVNTATNEVEIVPGQPATNDFAYGFSEVCVIFRSTTEMFYNPEIRFSQGGFTNTDFQGHAASYTVYVDPAVGVPNVQANAAMVGQVRMYLPQGTYHLTPYITPAASTYAQVAGSALDFTVGTGQSICLAQCLQVNLNAPACSSNQLVHITGTVSSCSNDVQKITYQLNGGATNVVCNNCGGNPAFAFDISLPNSQCTDNILTVTATGAGGGTSFVTTTIRYDVTPPVITCPADIMVSCTNASQPVTFTVTATDNCSGPITVVCTPPSGSFFPAGTNTVLCYAVDACGNRSPNCTFKVIVGSAPLTIDHAVILRWDCGVLQGADDPGGPWMDIPGATSPYCELLDKIKKFYRVRD